MNKNEFVLNVINLSEVMTHPHHGESEMFDDLGYNLSVTAWDNDLDHMVDEHITEFYPELLELGFDEPQEGDMYVTGSKNRMIDTLQKMGFQVISDTSIFEQFFPITPPDGNVSNKNVDALKRDMERAVEIEDYEEAARLRDIIKGYLKEEIKKKNLF